MAIPKRGTRRINVDGHVYRWLIRRKVTYCQLISYSKIGRLNVAIESAETAGGSTLWILTDRPHPKNFQVLSATAIRPSDVADWIRQSLQIGWQPVRPASPFLTEIRDGIVQSLY